MLVAPRREDQQRIVEKNMEDIADYLFLIALVGILVTILLITFDFVK